MIRGNRAAHFSLPQNRNLGENPFADFSGQDVQDLQIPDENEYDADLEADYYEN